MYIFPVNVLVTSLKSIRDRQSYTGHFRSNAPVCEYSDVKYCLLVSFSIEYRRHF